MKKIKATGTEERIIMSALNEFSKYGYAGARVDSIAGKAKVNKAMIYYHFKSKEKLYEKILEDIVTGILAQIKEMPLKTNDPLDAFYTIINSVLVIFKSLDSRVPHILLREIVDGGKYFSKIVIPNLLEPVFALIEPMLRKAKEQGSIRDVNPVYTFMHFIGSVLFFKIIREPISKSSLKQVIATENYADDYNKNLLTILKHGIEMGGKP